MPETGVSQSGDTGIASQDNRIPIFSRQARRKRRRAVCYEDVDRLPTVPTLTWYRMFALAWWRGTINDRYAHRMARHLTHHATKAGYITGMPKVIGLYASQHQVSQRIAWRDIARLVALGLLRKVHGAAPGRPAKYALCADLARLPDDFPKSLGRAVERVADDPRRRAKNAPTLASIHGALAACVTVRYGSRTCPTPIQTRGCGLVHTSLYTHDGPTPPPLRSARERVQDDHGLSSWGDKTSSDEWGTARDVLNRCVAAWRMQRAGQVPAGTEVPTKAGLASLEHLVSLLLRYMPPSEVEELLSAQVGSARDVAGLVRWRVGRCLRGLRRRRHLVVDDTGQRHAAWMAGQAARWEAQERSGARRAALEAARQAQARSSLSQASAQWARVTAQTAATPWASEPAEAFAAVTQELEGPVVDEREAVRQRAIARARAERRAKAQTVR
ncbi:hypothetical protein [Streptosporangium roseum]|uniref:hypothetical protein n=1 Tax=Streptosporangium roseum TaxID=2001 RepID=UPI00332B622F